MSFETTSSQPPLLVASDVSKHFTLRRTIFGRPLTKVRAVDDISFSLQPGETLAIVGESGCGKSTLGRVLMRLIEPSAGAVTLDGVELTALSNRDMLAQRSKIQLVFQDPYASLNPRMTIGQTVGEPLMLHNVVPKAQRAERVKELLKMVGLRPEHASRYPHEFSGGQRQRVVIARALASEPKILVCDEAVSALDVSIQAQVLNLLKSLQKKLGLAYIFISHDLSVVKHIADRVAVMYLGKVVELGETRKIFSTPRHPYTRALLSAIPAAHLGHGRDTAAHALAGDLPSPIDPPSGCRLHTRCPHARPECKAVDMSLDVEADGHANACAFWKELPQADDLLGKGRATDPRLAKLFAAFSNPLPEGEQASC